MPAPGATIELPPEPQAAACTADDTAAAWLDGLETLAEPITRATRWARSPSSGAGGARAAGTGWLVFVLFLRLAEEHGLEPFGTLRDLTPGTDVGPRLAALLRGAAQRYGVRGLDVSAGTHPNAARHAADADEDALLRVLLLRLYPAGDPHELSKLPPDTLGRLYERSLGNEPPRRGHAQGAARKAHGVFYTPRRVVDYVVERTLGRVLEGKDREEAARVRVLDPACGSGAFLLGAYRRLLEWHRDRRRENGETRLSLALRAQILQNAIYGVDLDAAAVEVAKLSLVLACFDGASNTGQCEQPAERQPHPALPCLDVNLRTGHSLVDTDWRDARVTLPGAARKENTARRAKNAPSGEAAHGEPANGKVDGAAPFPWRQAFPEIFAAGGFDVVIGNPPYLSFGGRHAVDISGELRRYYAEHYESGGWPTAHSLFLERSVKLLSRRFVSFVVPDQVGHLGGYRSARDIAAREAGLVEVRYWGERVFRGVTTPALTVVLDKEKKDATTEIVDRDGASRHAVFRAGEPWSVSPAATLIESLRRHSFSLGKLVGDCGIRTTSSRDQVVDWPAPSGEVVPVLEGKLIGRYGCRPPRVAVRLDSPRPLFISRVERYRDASFVIRQTASYPIVGPREHALYFRNSLLALFSPSGGLDVHYLVALLNSKLLRFVYAETVREAHQRTFPQVKVKALQSLPLRQLDVAQPGDKRRHDTIVELAMGAIAAQKATLGASGPEEERSSQRRFEAIDRQIDEAVYDLYELAPGARDTVEQRLAQTIR